MTTPHYDKVSAEHPCEICGKPDWCWRRTDGTVVYCRRVRREDGVERKDKNCKVYFEHRKVGSRSPEPAQPVDVDRVPLADAVTLDRAYNALLNHLKLSSTHYENLRARGLSDEAIARASYATFPVDIKARRAAASAVEGALGNADPCGVPGLFRDDEGADLELAGVPGLLIPVRDAEGLIRAVRVRLDNPPLDSEGKPLGKYRSLSVPRGAIGCGPGAHVHVPIHLPALRNGKVRIAEGEINAEVTTERGGILTIGTPGAAAFKLALDVVGQLGGKEVLLAFDADARRKTHVAAALQQCALQGANQFGVNAVAIEVWPEDAGNGIDDLLVGPRANELTLHKGSAMWAQLVEIAESAGASVEPLVEAYAELADITDRLRADPQGTAFDPKVLKAAGVLRASDLPGYERLTLEVKKAGARAAAWEKEVRKHTRHDSEEHQTDRRESLQIMVSCDETVVADEAIAALTSRENLYQRGGALVHIVRDDAQLVGATRPPSTPRIVLCQQALLRELCSASARWFYREPDKDGNMKTVEGHPPLWAVQALLERGKWTGIRHLEGVVEWPVLRPDGSVLTEAGYDAATGLLFAPNYDPPSIPDMPTLVDAKAAVALLQDVVCDFPFATDTHKAACIAAMLTPAARYAFSGPAPLMLIDKNTRGTGGSLLADVISEIYTGRPMARMSPSPNDEEERKRITSIAIAGTPNVLIDNVSTSLGTPSLDAALTATVWQDRILGASVLVQLPLAVTWFATGNNIPLVGDTSRRCLHIRLESKEERPEERTNFHHHPLLPWVRQNRATILGAALTLLRAFVVSGRPSQGLPPWGSFDAWSELVRDCLVWAGLLDPGKTRHELMASADDAGAALGALVEGWEEVAATLGGSCTAAQAINKLEEDYEKKNFQKLRAALEELVASTPGQLPSARRIGAVLKKYRGRVFAGKALVKKSERGETGNVWTVRAVKDKDKDKDEDKDKDTPPPPPPVRPTSSPVSPVSPVSDSASVPKSTEFIDGQNFTVSESALPPSRAEGDTRDTDDTADAAGAKGWRVRL